MKKGLLEAQLKVALSLLKEWKDIVQEHEEMPPDAPLSEYEAWWNDRERLRNETNKLLKELKSHVVEK